MKNVKFLSVALLVTLFSCKKNELERNINPVADVAASSTAAPFSAWIQSNNWTNTAGVYHTAIAVDSADEDLIHNGLVLLFMKTDGSPLLLPAQVGKTLWYYQAEKGSIQVNAVSQDNFSSGKEQQFMYLTLSASQLLKLEEKGITKAGLMNMNYSQLEGILH